MLHIGFDFASCCTGRGCLPGLDTPESGAQVCFFLSFPMARLQAQHRGGGSCQTLAKLELSGERRGRDIGGDGVGWEMKFCSSR